MIVKNGLKRSARSFKKKYFEWRYWDHLKKMMKNDNHHTNKDIQNELIPYINKPGIAFSFDDSFRINHWHKYGKNMFGYYDVKVTFNINAFHFFEGERELSQEEIDKLLDLQSNGHEIAHHGFKHRSAVKHSNEVGLSNWIEDEIISLFDWMDKQSPSKTSEKFKRPVTYSFPYADHNEEIISELIPKYFKIVRGNLDKENITTLNHTGFVPSICIDNVYLSEVKNIRKILERAKQSGKNVIFMCHSILPEEVDWNDFGWGGQEYALGAGYWRISPTIIKGIIDEARKIDLEFYTTSEIAGVATFIDHNFEKCVRKLISNPYDQWISISELSQIRELDLSNQNISNLNGLQYFLNLEKLNLRNNEMTDVRLLGKLQKLKTVDISGNPIRKEGLLTNMVYNGRIQGVNAR
jgi:peptidoglycan/xylan/chitin deacetylase (PgdA/CDA1 family)